MGLEESEEALSRFRSELVGLLGENERPPAEMARLTTERDRLTGELAQIHLAEACMSAIFAVETTGGRFAPATHHIGGTALAR